MNRKSTYFNQTWVRIFAATFFLMIALLVGCSGETILDTVFPTRNVQESVQTTEEGTSVMAATEVAVSEDYPTPQPTTQETQPFTVDQSELLIWVPEEFSTLTDSEASLILQQRIEDFERQNPGTVITVRVKASNGTSGILVVDVL